VVKIEAHFVEEYYTDLMPNVHYVPASLDNLTAVVQRVVAEENEVEMKSIITSANDWCAKRTTRNSLAKESMATLARYQAEVNWTASSETLLQQIDDLVECGSV